jgi:hypothetical protein
MPKLHCHTLIPFLLHKSHPARFNAINGLLLPGGGANLSPGHPFFDAAHYLVELALDANDKGDYFPVSSPD